MKIVQPHEFEKAMCDALSAKFGKYDYVTGPGRSGAIAAVYASHFLGIPFVPYKCKPEGDPLIVDTAINSGRTIRKASKCYNGADFSFAFHQPPRVKFWYESLSMARGRGNEFRLTA